MITTYHDNEGPVLLRLGGGKSSCSPPSLRDRKTPPAVPDSLTRGLRKVYIQRIQLAVNRGWIIRAIYGPGKPRLVAFANDAFDRTERETILAADTNHDFEPLKNKAWDYYQSLLEQIAKGALGI